MPTIKTIMAKLNICDWSPLNDSMVRIRAGTIRSLIKQVVALGAEEIEPDIEFLKVINYSLIFLNTLRYFILNPTTP